jgi:hypothetical protein
MMDWKTMLAYVTGSVDENLLLRIEYLVAGNRILRDQIKGRVQLSDAEPQALAEIVAKLGKQALAEVANIVQPDTILGWHCKLAAEKFDGSKQHKTLGRPRVDKELEDWVVRMAQENRSWGYDHIAGALASRGDSAALRDWGWRRWDVETRAGVGSRCLSGARLLSLFGVSP